MENVKYFMFCKFVDIVKTKEMQMFIVYNRAKNYLNKQKN